MLRLFVKKGFDGCKSKIFVIGDMNAGRGDRTVKARRCSVRHGDDFDWLGGHCENQGGRDIGAEVSWQASWLLFTPSPNKLIFGV